MPLDPDLVRTWFELADSGADGLQPTAAERASLRRGADLILAAAQGEAIPAAGRATSEGA